MTQSFRKMTECTPVSGPRVFSLLFWYGDVRRQSGRFAIRRFIMLYTIAIILIVLWLLGVVSAYTVGGFIHILLVVAIIMLLVRIISGRKPL